MLVQKTSGLAMNASVVRDFLLIGLHISRRGPASTASWLRRIDRAARSGGDALGTPGLLYRHVDRKCTLLRWNARAISRTGADRSTCTGAGTIFGTLSGMRWDASWRGAIFASSRTKEHVSSARCLYARADVTHTSHSSDRSNAVSVAPSSNALQNARRKRFACEGRAPRSDST